MEHIINVVDFELTCWETVEEQGDQPNEIIQIGIIKYDTFLDKTLNKIDIIVKPIYSEISEYCKDLTGLGEKGTRRVRFPDALRTLEKKFGIRNHPWVSWGEDDVAIQYNCELYGIENPFQGKHTDIGLIYMWIFGSKNRIGLQNAVERIGGVFEGRPHNAIVDTENAVKLIRNLL